MSQTAYVGAIKEIAFSKETVAGTPVAHATGHWQPHETFDIKPVVVKIKDEPGMGRIEETLDSVIVQTHSSGTATVRMTKEFMGTVLNMIFGRAPTTTGAGPFTHAYTVRNTNDHLSYTTTVKDPIKGMVRYAYTVLNEAQLTFEVDKFPMIQLQLEAGQEVSATGTPAYSTTDEKFLPQHVSIKVAANLAGLAAAPVLDVNKFELTAAKKVDKYFKLGSTNPDNIHNQRMGFAGTLTNLYRTSQLRDLAYSNTKQAMSVLVSNGTDSVEFRFPRVSFEEWGDDGDNNTRLMNSVNFFPEYTSADGLATATLINAVSTY